MRRLDIQESAIEYPAELMARLERQAEDEMHACPALLQSIFPRFEALLGLGVYRDALGFVADRQAMTKYHHLTDFALCALFPEYAEICGAYYEDRGQQLKDLWSPEEARRCERAMLCLLAIALAIRNDNLGDDAVCPVRWSTIVRTALEVAAKAPPAPAPQ